MLKTILIGTLIGTFIFFTGPLILVIILLKFIFTPFGMGRMMMSRNYYGRGMGQAPFAFAENVRNMSDEDYVKFQGDLKNNHRGCC